jgi:NAD(P)-dependent dehydrogenase (short-subunit alcohol dehydrogenase family)
MKRSIPRKMLFLGSAAAAAGFTAVLARRNSEMDLKDKVVVITGGSRGLGLALARGFAREGCSLVLCARNEDELKAAKEDLANVGTEVMTVPCDVADRAQVEHLIAASIERYGRIDVLVNNAGTIQVGPVDQMTIEDFQRAMDVMFWGTVYTTLAALPGMKQHRQARVVNITSVGAKVSVPHLVPYSCAKFAALAFSEGMRAELQGTGVKVVTIAPGLMRTGSYLNALFKGDDENEAAWFSVSSSLPGLSMDARRAAGEIISATRTGRAELTLSTPAKLLARFHGAFPGATADVLGLINRLLPRNGNQTARGADISGLRKPWLNLLTTLGRRAAEEFLQPGMP